MAVIKHVKLIIRNKKG